MAKVTNIPDCDNVLRHVRRKHLFWELDSHGNPLSIVGCSPEIFKLREKDEGDLSVNWIEFFEGNYEQRLKKTIKDFCSNYSVKVSDRFTQFNVMEFKDICNEYSIKVRIIHDAELKKSKARSHSSITNLPQDNLLFFDDLCKLAFKLLIPTNVQ